MASIAEIHQELLDIQKIQRRDPNNSLQVNDIKPLLQMFYHMFQTLF